MVDATRALLDELMGKDRNQGPKQKPFKKTRFDDPEICKHFICGFCPNELFTNTKSDLGTCTKVHDEYCRQEFQNFKEKDSYPYERDWIINLERLIDDLDRRIKRGHERLEHQDEKADIPLTPENLEKVQHISKQIQVLLQQIEDLGEEGKVTESQELMKLVDQLKAEKEQIILASDNRALPSQEKRMKVCEVCGAFLVVGDTEKRIASHIEGKQHQGFLLIRKTLDEWRMTHRNEDRKTERLEREKRLRELREKERRNSRERSSREPPKNSRERSRDGSREREGDKSRERERERERRRRDRERDFDDSRERKRYRDD